MELLVRRIKSPLSLRIRMFGKKQHRRGRSSPPFLSSIANRDDSYLLSYLCPRCDRDRTLAPAIIFNLDGQGWRKRHVDVTRLFAES